MDNTTAECDVGQVATGVAEASPEAIHDQQKLVKIQLYQRDAKTGRMKRCERDWPMLAQHLRVRYDTVYRTWRKDVTWLHQAQERVNNLLTERAFLYVCIILLSAACLLEALAFRGVL